MVQVIPLALLSELLEDLNAGQTNASASKMFDRLVEVSDIITRESGRRFDEYIKTRKYTCRAVARGGDLLSLYDLRLNYDLKSLSGNLTNGDDTPILTTDVMLLPDEGDVKRILRLDKGKNLTFRYTGDPVNSIEVPGVWGNGGEWIATGTTLDGGINDSVTSLVTHAALEKGMFLKIDSEYLYVRSIVTTTATVDRGVNGSTKAAHLDNAPVSRFSFSEAVRRAVKRFMAWTGAQIKSPLVGTATAPDGTVWPIDVSTMPKDLLGLIQTLGEAPTIEGV